MGDFLMPSLGADMEHGKIVEWLVKPGDYVRRGDLVAVVDTDKTVMDVESFQEGVVAELLVELGETVPVGHPAGPDHETPGRGGATRRRRRRRAPVPRAGACRPPPGRRPTGAAAPRPRHRRAAAPGAAPPIAPPVRHLAHRLGVDTATIHGTGKGGAITRADVERRRGGRRPRRAGRRAFLAAGPAARRANSASSSPRSAARDRRVP